MKPLILSLLTLLTAAAEPPALRAYVMLEGTEFREIWVTSTNASVIHGRSAKQGGEPVDLPVSKTRGVYFFEPPSLTEALKSYRAGAFAEAREKFRAVRAEFAEVQALPNNPATLAGFHELECLRQLGDLEGMAKTLEGFSREGLTRANQRRQLELDALWEATRTKRWEEVVTLAEQRRNEVLPEDQRAQVACCLGLALENLARPLEALDAFQLAISVAAGSSEFVTRQAVLHALALYKSDPEVRSALVGQSTPLGTMRLAEAVALAASYECLLGTGQHLPDEFAIFSRAASP